jgi:hypothetical protein
LLQNNHLKDIRCRNENCREVLGKTDNNAFFFLTPNGFYGKLQAKNLDIICDNCRRRTRWLKLDSLPVKHVKRD